MWPCVGCQNLPPGAITKSVSIDLDEAVESSSDYDSNDNLEEEIDDIMIEVFGGSHDGTDSYISDPSDLEGDGNIVDPSDLEDLDDNVGVDI